MQNADQLQQINNWLQQVLQTDESLFVVNIKIKPINNIKIYIDSDEALTIEKCVSLNRKLYKIIEESGFYEEGNFSLEISSPGIDEPLKNIRQYKKNVNRLIQIVTTDELTYLGKLTAINNNEIVVLEYVEGKGKKVVQKTVEVPVEQIKSAVVQIQF